MNAASNSSESGSGRAAISITKDTTIKVSWGVLALLLGWTGYASWWVWTDRQETRDRIRDNKFELSMRIDTLTADTNRRMDNHSSDVKAFDARLTGYSQRVDRVYDEAQGNVLLRHRVGQVEESNNSQERRMSAHEAKLDDLMRKSVVLETAIDYLSRNPGEPKKRNSVPLWRGGPLDVPNDRHADSGETE